MKGLRLGVFPTALAASLSRASAGAARLLAACAADANRLPVLCTHLLQYPVTAAALGAIYLVFRAVYFKANLWLGWIGWV